MNSQALTSYPQEMTGESRQRVKRNDFIERSRRYNLSWIAKKGERSRVWNVWQDLTDLIMPERGRFLTSDHNKPKDTSKILNGTPTRMARSLAAGLLAGHTSPARPWHNVTVPDPDLAMWGPMKLWLYNVNVRVRQVLALSNFYRAMAMGVYPDLAVYGLGTCIAEEDHKRVLRFTPFALGTYCLGQDGDGEIDTLQYEEPWTVGELIKEFGWENCSRSVRNAWNAGYYDQYVSVLRTIAPNSEFLPGTIGPLGKKWGSAWQEHGGLNSASSALAQPTTDTSDRFLRDGGYEEFPVLCARWSTTSRDVYPVGPGHDALPDARQLMQLERRKLLAISKGVNPTMLIPEELRLNRLSMLPGDAVYVPAGMKDVIKPAFVPDHQWVAEARLEAQACMQRIGQANFAELMLMFTDSAPGEGKQPVTAQEVAAKQQEKMLQLGPVLENINEFLTKLIERTIAVMGRRGLIPPAPREARNMRLKVEFISILAQAQKLVGTQSKERLVQFVGQVAQLKGPSALYLLDENTLIREYADDLGTPPTVLHDEEAVQKQVEAAAKQAKMQQQAQAMLTASQAAQNLGKTPLDNDNVMSRMLGPTAGAEAGGGA